MKKGKIPHSQNSSKIQKENGRNMRDRIISHFIFFIFMVFNATFNNISAISCRSVLLGEETGVPGENQSYYCFTIQNLVT
jgi:hypothetical protein